MRRALHLAAAAPGHGDVPIGAVVLDATGDIVADAARGLVAEAANERELTGDPTAHAEVLALRRAAEIVGEWRLDGCTLVVTIEPCTMCAGAAVAARVERIVFGGFEPKTGAVASLFDVVRDPRLTHRPAVVPGVLEADCVELMQRFFRA